MVYNESMSLKNKIANLPFYNDMVVPVHIGQALRAGVKFKWPGRKLKVIGVTGTNGKTTTSFMIWKMLNEAGRKTGLMTTVAWGVPGMKGVRVGEDGLVKQIEHMTTVDAETLNERIEKIVEEGAEFLVLEVTSHALAQYRTLGVPIEIAVFTNLTHEHLDYHKTMKRYMEAKMKLFKGAKFGVVNADDSHGVKFLELTPEGVSYGVKKGIVRATNIDLRADGVSYEIYHGANINLRIPGEFNVYNSLAAICVGRRLGLSDEEISDGLAALSEVEGRMNRIEEGQNFSVVVDFAHTPDALLKVFQSVAPAYGGTRKEREVKRKKGEKIGRIITVHGGAGRRDESTRAERGEIAGTYSDIFVVTEDDSRDEKPEKIMEMIAEGAKKVGMKEAKGRNKYASGDIIYETDRGKAIEKALKIAKKGDLVLLLGKGHEKTILRADGPHEFEDIKVAKKILRKLKD